MKPGRNDPCDCGSGKKFKHCCLEKFKSNPPSSSAPKSEELSQLDALFSTGRYAELESRARLLVDQYSDFGYGWKMLGLSLQMQGKNALPALQQAASLLPQDAEAHSNLAAALKISGQLEAAVVSGRKALQIRPDFAEAYDNLGVALQNLGQLDEALLSHQRAAKLKPHELQHSILAHLLLPVIPDTVTSIAKWRAHYQSGILALMNNSGSLDEPGYKLNSPSFYLAYHNANNRSMMEALCRMFRARVPNLSFTASYIRDWLTPKARCQRIRVGFLSEYLCDHTIGKHYQGFIRHLDRNKFEVVVIHTPKSKQDNFRKNLDASADKTLTLPNSLKSQQHAVAAEKLDVLIYPDIGMAPSTYFLAYARLAPVQATSWGHPDTSGLDTMDYYVSAVSNEPEQANSYYTEKLIRLSRLPCFYYQTPTPSTPTLSKAELGLPESGILYGCPQNLFKIHPDFDSVMATIAEGDPTSYLILPEGKYTAWTDLLKARWEQTFPVLLKRVLFIPYMSLDCFMALMAHMDVLLDPLHFGSGNTFYDAMAIGTPVVTWPGQFARGRNVAAAYRQMKVVDAPIATSLADYAPLALALGRDEKRRQALRVASIKAASKELFEDRQAVRELETFLEASVVAAGKGALLPPDWRPDFLVD